MIFTKVPRSKLKLLLLVIYFIANLAYSQENIGISKGVDDYFRKLEAEVKFDEKLPQKYQVTSYFHNRDIAGNTSNSIRMTGEFTRSLKDDQIHCSWNNVQMAVSQGSTNNYPKGQSLDFMNGLSYMYSEEMLTAEFFKNFPDQLRDVLKTLIWDSPQIEVVYMCLDKLKYNEPYTSIEFEEKEFQMADFAMLKMKDLRLTWIGLAKINKKLCALILFYYDV